MPEPAKDREKNACPSAYIQVFPLARRDQSGSVRYLYPCEAPGRVAMYTAIPTNITKKRGIITLLAFSMPEAMPYTIIAKVMARAVRCHPMFPNEAAV